MSCIHLHLGQAGNQIGKSFWGIAEEEYLVPDDDRSGSNGYGGGGGDGGSSGERGYSGSARPGLPARPRLRPGGSSMFHEEEGGWARCLAVDSEPKVVQSFQEQVRTLRPQNAIFSQSGMANNWAMGFAACRGEGSGNGGRGDAEDAGLLERTMEAMRKEAERCSWLNSIVMQHSLAGGTGSGLGSGLLQALRDEYPSLYIISVCVGACRRGETPLQAYNSTLALQHLQAFADAVIFRDNDDMLLGATRWRAGEGTRTEQQRLPPRTAGQNAPRRSREHSGRSSWKSGSPAGSNVRAEGLVSTADMNASFSLDLATYFFPRMLPLTPASGDPSLSLGTHRALPRPVGVEHGGGQRAWRTAARSFDGGFLMASACPIPSAKFVDLRSALSVDIPPTSSSTAGWAGLSGALAKAAPLCPQRAGGSPGDVCIAAHHVLRGLDRVCKRDSARLTERSFAQDDRKGSKLAAGRVVEDFGTAAIISATAEAGNMLRKHHMCPDWRTATDVSFSQAFRSRPVCRSVTTVCNQTRIREVLRNTVSQAERKFAAGAYLHWYYRYGLEEEDFMAAFEAVRGTAEGYDALARVLSAPPKA